MGLRCPVRCSRRGQGAGILDPWADFRHRAGTGQLTVRFGGGTVDNGLLIVIRARAPPLRLLVGIERRRIACGGGTASSGPSTGTRYPITPRHRPVGIEKRPMACGGGTAGSGPTTVISWHRTRAARSPRLPDPRMSHLSPVESGGSSAVSRCSDCWRPSPVPMTTTALGRAMRGRAAASLATARTSSTSSTTVRSGSTDPRHHHGSSSTRAGGWTTAAARTADTNGPRTSRHPPVAPPNVLAPTAGRDWAELPRSRSSISLASGCCAT